MRFVERSQQERGVVVHRARKRGARQRRRQIVSDYSVSSCDVDATALRASRSRCGSTFPLFSARRRIPAHALGLKKYRSGSGSGSKMSDKKHTLASLGQSVELSVQHSPCEAIPELRKGAEKASKGVVSKGQNSGDVLPEEPPRAKRLSQSRKLKGEVAAFSSESTAETGDTEALAGRPSDEEVDVSVISSKSI